MVDYVICTHNNRDLIGPTIEAVANQSIRPARCVVVDGLSADGTPDYVRSHYPWVDLVIKNEDSGPAASRNIGAARGSSPYVVFLDSDVQLSPDWTERQIRLLQDHPKAGIASGRLLIASRPGTLDAAYGTMNRYGVAWNQGAGRSAAEYQDPRRCLFACSAAMIARRDMLEHVGGFDEAMFAYHEDTDLGWRANLLSYEVIYNPAASALHCVHGTMNHRTMGDRIIYLLWRNRLRSALINYEPFSLLRYTSVFLVLSLLQALVAGPRIPKFRGLLWNALNLADTRRRRRNVQSARRVRDRELWPLFEPGVRGPGQFYE